MTAPAPAPARRPAVVAAAVLLVVLVCGTGAATLLSQVASGTVERTSTFPAVGRFVVDTDSGDVAVGPSADGQVHVRTVVRHGPGEPELIEESTAAGLRLDVECNDVLISRCDVTYAVEVPPNHEVVIGGTEGDVTASRLAGPVTVDRATGDIAVFDLSGPLDLRTSTGEIDGAALRAEIVRAGSDTGDVRLDLQTAPRSLDVVTSTGEVDVAVPGDTTYRIDARTAAGEQRVLVPSDPAAPRVLRVAGDTGDITLRPSR